MIIPVRCISCGRVLAGKWEQFKKEIESGKDPKKVLDSLGMKNYCCRSQFITHVELINDIAKFKSKILHRN